MKKLRMPPNCVEVTDPHGGCITLLIGTATQGDGFVDALRKSLRPLPAAAATDDVDSNGKPFD